jgi:hypothetical protein
MQRPRSGVKPTKAMTARAALMSLALVPGDEWDVYDPDGVYLGIVRMPRGMRVLEIGLDHVLGTSRDDLDVEYVELHALHR